MPRKPNYRFERLEREKAKAAKKAAREAAKKERADARKAEAAQADDWERAAEVDEQLRDLHQALFIEPNPIPVKYAVSQMGLIEPGLRLPLTPLAGEHQAAVVTAMTRAGVETV